MKPKKLEAEGECEGRLIWLLQDLYSRSDKRCDLHEPDICGACGKRQLVIDFVKLETGKAKRECAEEMMGLTIGTLSAFGIDSDSQIGRMVKDNFRHRYLDGEGSQPNAI